MSWQNVMMYAQSIPTYEDYKDDKDKKSGSEPAGELSPDELIMIAGM